MADEHVTRGAAEWAAGGRPSLREWESAVERAIRQAQERGDFDGLAGAGKPLRVEPWDSEWGMAHHVLKQAGETLPWIALGQEIQARRAELRQWLQRTCGWLEARRGQPGWDADRLRARDRYLARAAELDQLLVEYSFSIPIRRLEQGRLPAHIAAHQFDEACPG